MTKTPPPWCFCDPIEEFFGIFDIIFKKKYQHCIVSTGYYNPLTRKQIKELITNSLIEADRSLIKEFRRALLFLINQKHFNYFFFTNRNFPEKSDILKNEQNSRQLRSVTQTRVARN